MTFPKVGDIATGTVVRVYSSYAILYFDEGWTGLLHISELSHNFIRSFTRFVTIGSIYNVKVISVDEEGKNVRVSLKQMTSADKRKAFHHQAVHREDIDPTELMARLPQWIEEENKEN